MPRGGYRQPANPAPVSGPGALSRRTDGRQPIMDIPDARYGENLAYRDIQGAAPLPQVSPTGTGGSPPQPAMPPPLTAGTTQPGMPVTAGADAGPGPGSEVLASPQPQRLSDVIALYAGADLTGALADLYSEALSRGL